MKPIYTEIKTWTCKNLYGKTIEVKSGDKVKLLCDFDNDGIEDSKIELRVWSVNARTISGICLSDCHMYYTKIQSKHILGIEKINNDEEE